MAEYYGIFNKVPPYTRSTTITSLFSKNHHRSSRMSNFNSDHFETTSTKQGYSLKKVNTFVPMPIHKRSSSINRLRNNYKSLRQNSSIISNFDKKVHLNYVRKTKNNSRLNLTQLERIIMGKNLLNKSNKNSRAKISSVTPDYGDKLNDHSIHNLRTDYLNNVRLNYTRSNEMYNKPFVSFFKRHGILDYFHVN